MPELEDRLRATLTAAADEVPTSVHPRAELDRRLTARRRSRARVPAVAAAAAAVVVAAVAVPVALDRDPPGQGIGPAASSVAVSTDPSGHRWSDYLTPPTRIAWYGDHEHPGFRKLSIGLNDDQEVCFLVLDGDERPVGGDPLCEPLPDWGPDHFVESRSPSDLDLAMPPGLRDEVEDMLVFLVSPEVQRLDVRRGDGTEVLPTAMVTGDHGWGFVTAKFGGSHDGFGYTAYDDEGNVLVEAIT